MRSLPFTLLCSCLSTLAMAEEKAPSVPPPVHTPSLSEPSPIVIEKKVPEKEFRIYLEPRQKTTISAEITSQVERIPKRMGERFKSGALLVKLSSDIFETNYQKALKIMEKAETEEAAARRLYDNQALSLIEFRAAQAQLATAVADLSTAQKFFQSTQIFAPYTGRVVKVLINEFELAQPGKEIMEIIDEEYLFARFLAPGDLYTEFYPGRKVLIHLDYTNEEIEGKIKWVSPVIDAVSNTVKVEAEIDNAESKWVPGMAGKLRFEHPLADSEFYSFIEDTLPLNFREKPEPGSTYP